MRLLILCATLALAGCQSTTTSAPVQSTPVAAVQSTGGMMALLNAERAGQGLRPLREDPRLSRAARAHAADMAAKGYFSHTGADGSRFYERAADAGYSCAIAENIAEGQRSEADVMTSWMGSAAHRRNILLPDTTDYGIGRVGNYWVQMFGRGC